jgi:molybdopterin adenylyltransferase
MKCTASGKIMPIKIAILTVSDRSFRGEREDLSGPALQAEVSALGWQVVRAEIVPDEIEQIAATLAEWADSGLADVILTSGGTGFALRDVTPEATRRVIERLTPGLDEAMRAASLKITAHAMLSRAVSGIRKTTLILNLPGSPRGAVETLAVVAPVLPHAVELLRESHDAEQGHRSV